MASSEGPEPLALGGIRVLSFGTFVAGNLCALLLAEMGADVVKVESRDYPDTMRGYALPGLPPATEPSGAPTSGLFGGLARSTRGICVDPRSNEGCATLRALAAHADVVIENLGPRTMASWGCSASQLRAGNPTLVVLSMSGYGRTGPLSTYRAYASNVNNYVGLTAAWALDGTHFDLVAAIHGAAAVLAALHAVRRGAHGVDVDLAETETAASVMAPLLLGSLANGEGWRGAPNEVPGSWLSAVVACRGHDAWLAVELEDDADRRLLCRFLGRDDLTAGDRAAAAPAVEDALAAWAASRRPIEATLALQRAGIAAGAVQHTEDVWRDPQHRTRQGFAEVEHPDVGTVEYPGSLSRLGRTPGRIRSRAPRLGEHTRGVLAEWLGHDDDTLGHLLRTGAVWQSEPGEDAVIGR